MPDEKFDPDMRAYCGAYCGVCAWREKTGCKGCKAQGGQMFWGTCDKATCCIQKGFEHCGGCPNMPCQMLKDLFYDPEHGDGGARLENLENWRDGKQCFRLLDNPAQKKANKKE